MKHNRKNNISAWLFVLALLLTTACADHADLYLSQAGNESSNIVEITVQPPVSSLMTRTDGDEDGTMQLSHISDGSKVDVLIYALYEKSKGENGQDKYTIVIDPEIIKDIDTETGQVCVKLTKENYPYRIQPKLASNSKKEYKMVFWAQTKECEAYDTRDLENVKVIYDNAKNNDELRDAFCTSIEINNKKNRYEAILRRPFAQINVGTTGWDYEGAAILEPSAVSYTKSQITLNGVAQYYNVLEGKAIVEESGDKALTSVTFSYNTIPAFINASKTEMENLTYAPVTNEEYLKVHLYDDDKTGDYGYKSWEYYKQFQNPESDEAKEALKTETYKYLSMCYVLVPEAKNLPAEGEEGHIDNVSDGAVLSSVKFEAKGQAPKDENAAAEENVSEVDALEEIVSGGGESEDELGIGKVFEISNVPVQKNWRTNILGNSFFIGTEKFKIDIVPDYMGDYNFNSDGDKNVWPNEGGETYYASFNTPSCTDGTKDVSEGSKGFFSFEPDKGHEEKNHVHFECKNNVNFEPKTDDDIKNNKFRKAKYTGTLLQGELPSQFDYCLQAGRRSRIRFKIDTPSTVYILQSTGNEWKKNDTTQKLEPYDGFLTLIPDYGDDMTNYENYLKEQYILDDQKAITEDCLGCRLHVIKDLPAGSYIIKTWGAYENNDYKGGQGNWINGGGECGIYYVEVQTQQVQTQFPNEDLDEDIKNDYYGTNKDNNQGE